ncbi:hypothetical protein BVRB_9g209400 [Beta vulgaris subsp. vulgaris]|nr:hypothetical protein BVRB_9g209400 [Beta vulgaris subsp. vulgaris]
MSGQSESQNSLGNNFMTESEPSSPSLDGGQSSSVSTPMDGKSRLLADLPLKADMAKELRSKFLNDHSTPEQENLTSQYLSARMSGDNQTLKELRHQILARRTLRNPPPDVVPGLDVQHLSMDETGTVPSTSGQDPASHPNEITIGESSAMPSSSRPEPIPDLDDVLHFGIWLPIDYSSGPKNTIICKGWRAAALDLKYYKVDLKAEQAAKLKADKKLADLRLKAKELAEVKKKKDELELALMAAQDGTSAAVENAKVEAGRLALAAFKKPEEFVGPLGERYDGGWVAAKRCVCNSHL